MDIKVDINSKQIEKQVTEAIIKSAIGEKIKESIDSMMKDGGYRIDSIIEKVVESEMKSIIRNTIVIEQNDTIKKLVTKAITEEAIQKVIDKVFKDSYY